MKIRSAALAALFVAAVGWLQPAQAQVPQGSYLSSCDNIDMRGNALVATCRRAGGGALRTALAGVNRCVGDIGNNNGVLQCTLAGGGQARGQVVQGPGVAPGPGPGYGRDDRRESRWERCRELHARAEDLRTRRDWAWYPDERARLENRLRRVHEEQRELRCRY